MLAYSAIGQAGYVLVALGLGGPVGVRARRSSTRSSTRCNKTLLFLAVDLRGPLVGAARSSSVPSASPACRPTAGFFGKPRCSRPASTPAASPRSCCCSSAAALTFIYLFQAYQHDHWQHHDDGAAIAPVGPRLVVAFVALLVLVAGVWPEPLIALADQAAGDLTGGGVR